MPELPEVDMMVRRVRNAITGKWLAGVKIGVRNPGLRYFGEYDTDRLISHRFEVFRAGKVMVFRSEESGEIFCAHNMMSGHWDTEQEPWTFDYVEGAREPNDKHIRVWFTFDDGTVLRFHDSRLFGQIEAGDRMLRNLGDDALQTPVSYRERKRALFLDGPVWERLGGKEIKLALMDQSLVAGIGNIYAAEALWLARIHPQTRAGWLTKKQCIELENAVEVVLQDAIDRDCDYSALCVYRRWSCPSCDSRVMKVEVAKRSTYFCEDCQPAPKERP